MSAVHSDEQNRFLLPFNGAGSVYIPRAAFPNKGVAFNEIAGAKAIVNYDGKRATGSHGKMSLRAWRASIEGYLERIALILTRSSDSFHITELQGDMGQTTDFAGCPFNPASMLKRLRNDVVSDEAKRRWRFKEFFWQWLYDSFQYFGNSTFPRFVNGDGWYDAAWGIAPTLMTTTKDADELLANDITNASRLVTPAILGAELGGVNGLNNLPCGRAGDKFDDELIQAIQHRWVDVTLANPYRRVDGTYFTAYYFVHARNLNIREEQTHKRRVQEEWAWILNLYSLMRIACWVAYEQYEDSRGQRHPRTQFTHYTLARSVGLLVDWDYENERWTASVSNAQATESSPQHGRYAKFGYREDEAYVSQDFQARYLYSAYLTLGAAINDYFADPVQWAWIANYFTLVENDRTIPNNAENYAGQQGTFVWVSGNNIFSFIRDCESHGFYFRDKTEQWGHLEGAKEFSGIWTNSDGEYGNTYFDDVDYPCTYAIDEGYIGNSSQEWLYGIGYLEVEFESGGSAIPIYDAFKADGGAVITNRERAADQINRKYLDDIWRGFAHIGNHRIHGSKQAMLNWMNSFRFAGSAGGAEYDANSLLQAVQTAEAAAQWHTRNMYCFVGVNQGGNQFADWAGLWYTYNSAGTTDDNMYRISPEDTWGTGEKGYEIADKSFSVPVWCRDFADGFLPYEEYSAQGEIETWIGAFKWAWKAIAFE